VTGERVRATSRDSAGLYFARFAVNGQVAAVRRLVRVF
jgi:hypothetical protein